ncbi:dihydrodipicolinate synthase family protein [Candidatus Bipolaricaulota bacterium]|nr:dihydrodipicolinate synthase family protein [Candidatus Bipolaricaulota bacterium]
MKNREGFSGVWVALVTPWDREANRIKDEAIPLLVERFARAGVRGLFVLGTTGEGTLLSTEARMAFAETILAASHDELPVIVHTGHDRPEVARALSLHAAECGAVGVAVAPPCRYRLSQEELRAHYLSIARAVEETPLFLYDIPATTGNPLGAALLRQLTREAPNVTGAKVSRGDWESWEEYLELGEELVLLVGTDELAFPLLSMGASGLVSSCANIFPDLYVRLFQAAQANEVALAAALQRLVIRLCRLTRRGRVEFVKAALNALGQDVGEPIPPLLPLNTGEKEGFIPSLHAVASEAKVAVEERR